MAAAPAPWGGNRVQQCWCFQPVGLTGRKMQMGAVSWGPAWHTEAWSFFVPHTEKALGTHEFPPSPALVSRLHTGSSPAGTSWRSRRWEQRVSKNEGKVMSLSMTKTKCISPTAATTTGGQTEEWKEQMWGSRRELHGWLLRSLLTNLHLPPAGSFGGHFRSACAASSASGSFPVNRQKVTDDAGVSAQHPGFHYTQNIMKFLS